MLLGVLLIVFSFWDRLNPDLGNLSLFAGVFLLLAGTGFIILAIKAIAFAREGRFQYGTSFTAPLQIFAVVFFVLLTGLLAPNVMIGDEVTHYYMMKTQLAKLPVPNFFAEIPNGWGGVETRRYPHSFFWHYLGAIIYLFTGGKFFFIQLYQALFLGQLLIAAYLLAATRGGLQSRSALIYILLIASLPMTLIFSVAFYQDIPMTAQVVTSFYLLSRRRWVFASLFLCLALGIKVTAILFFPPFFLCLFIWTVRNNRLWKSVLVCVGSLLIVCCFTFVFGKTIHRYSYLPFFPVYKAEQMVKNLTRHFDKKVREKKVEEKKVTKSPAATVKHKEKPKAKIIANHPGDLRIKKNFVIYGGLLLYIAIGAALFLTVFRFTQVHESAISPPSSLWLWGVGGSYIIVAAFFLKEAPDARFFLPGLVFCLLPVAEKLAYLPWRRWVVMMTCILAVMQGGYALSKTYTLRKIPTDIQKTIHYLKKSPPKPRTVFMYPEGSYRYFPVPHQWYLRYRLREFWRADNDHRIEMLNEFGVGAIVVKKHLISRVDKKITDLGVYPTYFVKDIKQDSRFKRVFENSSVIIFLVPPVDVNNAK